MTILRQRPWLVALIALAFGIVLRLAPWPLSIAGGAILTALTIWGAWAIWRRRAAIWGWVRTKARTISETVRPRRAAPYRFDGEQANHAAQANETAVSIAHFEAEAADPDITPERRHWLNAHRAGMENRLAVLETTPRLTVEQMNERDAIETHLYGAPLARGRAAKPLATIKPLFGGGAVAGALGGWQLWAGGALLAFGLGGWGMAWVQAELKESIERDRDVAVGVANRNGAAARAWRDEYEAAHQEVISASQQVARTTVTMETERRIRRQAQQEARRIRDAVDQARLGGPPDYGFDGVRDGEPSAGGAAAGDSSIPPAGPAR